MSPRFKARIAGLMYLLIFITAPSGAATATWVRLFVNLASDTGVALIFFNLFRPVSRRLSFVASLFRITFVVAMSVNTLNYFGAIEFLQPSHSSASFNSGYGIALIPCGIHCVLTGYLVVKSTFLPQILGALMVLGRLGLSAFSYGLRLVTGFSSLTLSFQVSSERGS